MSACRPKTQVSAWESSSRVVSSTESIIPEVTLDTLRHGSKSSLVVHTVSTAKYIWVKSQSWSVKSQSWLVKSQSGMPESGLRQFFSLLREEGWWPATAGLSQLRSRPHFLLDAFKALSSVLSPSLMSLMLLERSRFLELLAVVSGEVVLLHVQLDILVEGKVGTVTLVPESLKLCEDCCPAGNRLRSTKELSM
jgi:hypothetical protein